MKDFFKKNIVLVVILAISLLFSLSLAFFAFTEWRKLKGYQVNLVELRAKIEKLNEERPYPLQENLTNIKNDTAILLEKLTEINRLFGRPYENALKEFMKTLAKEEEEHNYLTSLKEWEDFFKKNYKKNESAEKLLSDFLSKKGSPEKVQEAKKAFIEVARKRSVEDINDSTVNGMILESLSIPRNLSPDACKVYTQNMEIALFDFAKSDKFGSVISIDEKSRIFKVYEDSEKLPPADFIPHIIKHYKLLEDLLYRMKASGVETVSNIQKLNGLEGIKDGQYLIFTYKLDFSGTSESARKMIENLQKAFEDNRIYVIRYFSLVKAVDEVKKTPDSSEKKTTGAKKGLGQESENIADSSLSEAKIILGLSDKVNVELKFDYIVYVGDEQKAR